MEHCKPRPLVLHIIYALGTGGLENGLVNIINNPESRRYRHAIICLTERSPFSKRIMAEDVEIIELRKRPGHDFGLYLRLLKALRTLKPAVVHTRNLAAQEMQLFVALATRAARVHGEHGRDIHDLDGTSRKYRALRRFLKMFIHHYIAVSRDLADWLIHSIKVPPPKVHQIYNGVDQTRFRPEGPGAGELMPPGFIDSDSVVIGTVGRLAEVKNQSLLIQAFGQLLQRDPQSCRNLRLVIVGEGPLRAELERQIRLADLEKEVWLAGDRNDIPPFLRTMHIFVLPSLAEGISNTVLEAMATGLPVIATRVGGNPELIEDGVNGVLVPSGSPEALATALEELVRSPGLRERLGKEALARIRDRFDWQKATREYLAVYDQALGIQGTAALRNHGNKFVSGK